MKFMTWNVNGIRALTQYHPYCDDLHKNYKEILDYLDADVICLQETKITRAKLESDLALVPGYDSYWSFHRTKSGYSGVVVYVKEHIKLLAAEEGISGVLSGNFVATTSATSTSTDAAATEDVAKEDGVGRLMLSSFVAATEALATAAVTTTPTTTDFSKRKVGGYPTLSSPDPTWIHNRFLELDTEGRGLVLDLGMFVLFNLYCPNETDETRLPFKMDFYHLLEARVKGLIQEGREVIVLGDMNVIPTELDHCDPQKWKKECGKDDFGDTPPRKWFNGFLSPQGPMVDVFRRFHPGERGAFTCWNTKINARPSNYGTRLDYILVTAGILPWFKSCERLPHIVGSDHCPVVAEMASELDVEVLALEQEEQHKVEGSAGVSSAHVPQGPKKLQDILDAFGGTTDHPLAAKYFDEFSGKQQKLSSFFKKPAVQMQSSSVSSASSSPPTLSPSASPRDPPSSVSSQPLFSKMREDTKRPAASDTVMEEEPLLRKRQFFGSAAASTMSSAPVAQLQATLSTKATASSIPKSASGSLVGSQKSRQSTKGNSKKQQAGSKSTTSGPQQMKLSFFTSSGSKSTQAPAIPPSPSPQLAPRIGLMDESVGHLGVESSQDLSFDQSTGDLSMDGADTENSFGSSSGNNNNHNNNSSHSSTSNSQNTTTSTTFSPSDFADWIPGSQDVLPFATNEEATTFTWQNLFAPKATPKCRGHHEPCKEFRVNKKGPNQGRRFFLCSKPVGPEGDHVGFRPEYRCNHFEWLNPGSTDQKRR